MLPQDDEYEDESTDESGDERSDDDYDGNDDDDDSGNGYLNLMKEPEWGRKVSPLPESNGRTMELTPLLEERLGESEGRDKAMITRIRPTLTTDKSDY